MLCTNSGKGESARLNVACRNAWYGVQDNTTNAICGVFASHLSVGDYNVQDRNNPSTTFTEMLSCYGLPVKSTTAFDLTIRLDLDGNDAVRVIRVPSNITFDLLHKVIQKAYCWNDYHLYHFCFYKDDEFDYFAKPEIELVASEEDFEFKPDGILMQSVKLSEYFPKRKKCVYNYDYGDNWYHHIELSGIVEDCDEELPKLLLGSGDAPPEDVGGVGGFADFLRVIADPNDEDYEHFTEWAKSQWWKRFDFKYTAGKVKYSLWW